ncbi:MAG: glycosyltransferase family 2 protein [Candidatus Omnitrophota bacterium]|jgi:glycosyltransferase involved in cell wall biosynthesis|nr:glycosyltransferase family 2 protein [Candidatus Omnitrophota bacterium]
MKNGGSLKVGGITKKSEAGKPLVSIVTPVFNGKQYLEEAIASVAGQTYDNIEHIIIDGGSTDGSLDIIKKHENEVSYWLSEPDSGMYEAVNKGLKIASGDILAYLNSDDLYCRDTVQMVVECFQGRPDVELVYGNCDFIGSNSEFLHTRRYPEFHWESFISSSRSTIPQPATFWRNTIHKKIGYFDAGLKMCGDFDFYARAGRDCRFFHIKKSIAKFRVHGASLSSTSKEMIKDEIEIVRKRYAHTGKIHQLFSRYWLELKIKLLNRPLMVKLYNLSQKRSK